MGRTKPSFLLVHMIPSGSYDTKPSYLCMRRVTRPRRGLIMADEIILEVRG